MQKPRRIGVFVCLVVKYGKTKKEVYMFCPFVAMIFSSQKGITISDLTETSIADCKGVHCRFWRNGQCSLLPLREEDLKNSIVDAINIANDGDS